MKATINNRVQRVNVNTGTGPQGKAGRDGTNGTDGTNGFNGMPAEFQFAGGWLQWRLVGSLAWINLVAEADLEGPMGQAGNNGKDGKDGKNGTNGKDGTNGRDGVDGFSVELRKTATALQWRVVGGTWADLISIADITGPEGKAGKDGGKGADGSNGTDGVDGTDGTDGREIEIQRSATHLQWRYVGDPDWTNIILLADLEGPAGVNGKDGTNGKDGVDGKHGPAGKDGVDGTNGTDGADGKSAEFRKSATDIEWRLEGGTWASLITIAEITGSEGKRGPIGPKGDSFTINEQGTLAGRDAYDGELEGFAYLATDVGALFIRQGASGWSDAIPFGKGEDGKSAYDVAVEAGFVGDVDAWLLSLHGQEVSLRRGATNLEWRLGDGPWNALISIVDITGPAGKNGTNGKDGTDGKEGPAGKDGTDGIDGQEGPIGPDGEDGREVQLRVFGLFIQWRYVGDVDWTDLIALADITGPAGKDGANGKDGTNGIDGVDGEQGIHGVAGIDGKEVSLSANSTHIQWRLGDGGWQDLVALIDLKGKDGTNGKDGVDGGEGPAGKDGVNGQNGAAAEFRTTVTHIQWRLIGSPTWIDLLPLTQITGPAGKNGTNGANGREVEIQNSGGFIQWRFVGDPAWINIVSIADLVGPVGPAGTTKWDGIEDKPASFPPSEHNHDGRYYTKEQIDNALLAYAKLESPTFTGEVKVTGSLVTTGTLGSEGA